MQVVHSGGNVVLLLRCGLGWAGLGSLNSIHSTHRAKRRACAAVRDDEAHLFGAQQCSHSQILKRLPVFDVDGSSLLVFF